MFFGIPLPNAKENDQSMANFSHSLAFHADISG
jgi:hypothetical protein